MLGAFEVLMIVLNVVMGGAFVGAALHLETSNEKFIGFGCAALMFLNAWGFAFGGGQ